MAGFLSRLTNRFDVVLRRAKLKVVVVGERAVGKTSLIQKYMRNHFSPDYKGTLGVQMYPVEVEVPLDGGDVVLAKVAIFDLMGEHAARDSFRDAIFYGTHGVLAVCDAERPDTLYALPDWIRAATAVTGGVPFTIALNKVDRAENMEIGKQERDWLRQQYPLAPFIPTSAMTGKGVEEAFHGIFARAVAGRIDADKARHRANLLRQEILVFISGRQGTGASKTELFARFKEVPPAQVMQELDHLVRLELLALDVPAGQAFVQTSTMPATTRFRITPEGRKVAENPSIDEMVIEEPT